MSLARLLTVHSTRMPRSRRDAPTGHVVRRHPSREARRVSNGDPPLADVGGPRGADTPRCTEEVELVAAV